MCNLWLQHRRRERELEEGCNHTIEVRSRPSGSIQESVSNQVTPMLVIVQMTLRPVILSV